LGGEFTSFIGFSLRKNTLMAKVDGGLVDALKKLYYSVVIHVILP